MPDWRWIAGRFRARPSRGRPAQPSSVALAGHLERLLVFAALSEEGDVYARALEHHGRDELALLVDGARRAIVMGALARAGVPHDRQVAAAAAIAAISDEDVLAIVANSIATRSGRPGTAPEELAR
jgi:hypothetical protein